MTKGHLPKIKYLDNFEQKRFYTRGTSNPFTLS